MLRIGICDDEEREIKAIEALIRDYVVIHPDAKLAVRAFTVPFNLLSYVERTGCFDILFLDVYMQGMLGTEVAKEIKNRNENCAMIFLTTSRAHAVDAYALDAIQYITKPYTKEQFFAVLDKVINIVAERNQAVVFKTSGGVVKVNKQDIIYTCTNRHYQNVYLVDGRELEIRIKSDELFDQLGAESGFVRCGVSYIVALRHIKEITTKEITMDNGDNVPIVRGAFKDIRDKYMSYMFN